MWDATSEEDQDKYNVSLSEVDLNSPQLDEALKCCGWEDEPELTDLMKVDSLHSYGARAPLNDWSGGNANKLIASAKRESKELDNPETYEIAMSRPVNKLGSTAREYANGDINSAIMRGIEKKDPIAELMGKITFGTINQNGVTTNSRQIAQADIRKCKFSILVAEHYREDGSCKCNDPVERKKMIEEWEYSKEDFADIPLAE